ncbi:MAG: type IV pilus twitching motility protein PilT [Gemmatimonadetes bacterium]|jgi:twitching motility protein PilT|nr:type IV pilus twitching motility protein PilT [Gemmatimonadota bacterium]MBP7550262.1 type IV pilus twitching motility protein PilT [Gemmatimonadaceae bacterium]
MAEPRKTVAQPAGGAAPAAAPAAGAAAAPPYNFKFVLQTMAQQGGSDLHLKIGRAPTMRLNGELVAMDLPALRPEDLRSIGEQIIPPKQRREFDEAKDADFAIGVPGVGRFRVNVYQQRGSLAYAFRAIAFQALSMEELNLPGVLKEIAMRPRGLVLVTGITGSGKSTALASMIQYVNENKHANVITIEDPIEFLHRDIKCHINQREVGTDTTSFAQALRRVLRQDPDIIMIGEIRDLETLEIALKAADTGHMVFSTLHTMDATQTINRILSFYPPHEQADIRFQLSTALQAVICLRLVPRADKAGRIPATEILVNSAAVSENIRDATKALSIPELIREGTVQYGMQSFDQSLLNWYKQGVISYESALAASTSPSEFALRVQGIAGSSEGDWSQVNQGAR